MLEASGGDARINVQAGSHTISAPLSPAGSLTIDTQAGANLAIDSAMPIILSGDLAKTGDGDLTITNRILTGAVNLQGGSLSVGENVLAFQGGPVTIGPGLSLQASGHINRQVIGAVTPAKGVGDDDTKLIATGNMIVGNLTAAGGYSYTGDLVVGPHTVNLTRNGAVDLYGAELAGGTLTSSHGIRLLPVDLGGPAEAFMDLMLTGNGTVEGNIDVNGGLIFGTFTDALKFTGIIGGGGTLIDIDTSDAVVMGSHTLPPSKAYTGVIWKTNTVAANYVASVGGPNGGDLAANIPGDYDQLIPYNLFSDPNLSFDGKNVKIEVVDGYTPDPATDSFSLFADAHSIGKAGFFSDWAGATITYAGYDFAGNGYDWVFDFKDEGAGQFWSATLTAGGDQPPPIPEPSTLVLLAVGMAAMLLGRRRS
jgi:hypothetical protein